MLTSSEFESWTLQSVSRSLIQPPAVTAVACVAAMRFGCSQSETALHSKTFPLRSESFHPRDKLSLRSFYIMLSLLSLWCLFSLISLYSLISTYCLSGYNSLISLHKLISLRSFYSLISFCSLINNQLVELDQRLQLNCLPKLVQLTCCRTWRLNNYQLIALKNL